ncbi:lysophospholipid acyltransferase family protein [Methylocucumis oryzae]|uniref:lysophospholipid acyltransferase family protein n=1 Tax=Methylocucumis oryzae TaxID=1632867 RepID=UPI000698BDE0|nr:1-acyl-sn-glycerol-3-phosphate acyltransferase [Methylocucumis oryzae]
MAIAEKIVWLLKQQSNIIIFPEGTTTVGDDVLNFHASLFQPALLTKVPIQPVAIQYSDSTKSLAPFVGDDAFVPHLLRMLALDNVDVTITLLPLVSTTGKTRQAVSVETRELIRQHIVEPQDRHSLKHRA